MISRAGRWTRTPSTTPLQPKKWNAHILIMFNFWWLARLVNGLEPHPPPLSSQKNEMLIFGFCSTSHDLPGWLMDSNPIHHPSPAKKMKCSFLDYVQLLMIGRAGRWTQTPSTTPLQPKNEMLIFVLCSTSDDQPGWLMDSNPIHHPSPAKKMKCSFLDYVQLLMISRACRWTWTPSTTCLQPKNEMLIFWLCSTSDDQPGCRWTRTPSATPLLPKKWNAHFCNTFNFWWTDLSWTRTPSTTPLQPKKWNASFLDYVQLLMISRAGDGLKPHPPPLSSQKNEMLIFGLHSTSDDWPGWSMDSNPIHHSSPAKKNEMLIFGLCSLLMISQAVDELKPHLPPLSSQKNEMLIFVLRSTSDDQLGLSMDLNPIHHLSPAKKWNAHILIMFNFWWLARLVNGLNPIHHLSPAKKMKCSFLDFVQLLMCQAGWWTQTPSTTPLQPKNEMLIFGLCSTSDD